MLNGAVCIPFSTDTSGKDMNPTTFLPAMSRQCFLAFALKPVLEEENLLKSARKLTLCRILLVQCRSIYIYIYIYVCVCVCVCVQKVLPWLGIFVVAAITFFK